jgi:hypothetical protein
VGGADNALIGRDRASGRDVGELERGSGSGNERRGGGRRVAVEGEKELEEEERGGKERLRDDGGEREELREDGERGEAERAAAVGREEGGEM